LKIRSLGVGVLRLSDLGHPKYAWRFFEWRPAFATYNMSNGPWQFFWGVAGYFAKPAASIRQTIFCFLADFQLAETLKVLKTLGVCGLGG
jgi:hypothetical protein